eukprot:6784140-Pyramimonas_sp.AAC.1
MQSWTVATLFHQKKKHCTEPFGPSDDTAMSRGGGCAEPTLHDAHAMARRQSKLPCWTALAKLFHIQHTRSYGAPIYERAHP